MQQPSQYTTLVLICLVFANEFQVEGALTSVIAKARRTQSMRTHSRTGSFSPKMTLINEQKVVGTEPIASTSQQQTYGIDNPNYRAVDIQPVEDGAQRTSLLVEPLESVPPPLPPPPSPSLTSVSSHSSGQINPVRSRIFARLRGGTIRYGAAAAVGTAVGVAAAAAAPAASRQFSPSKENNIGAPIVNNNNITAIANTTEKVQANKNLAVYFDEIENPM